MTVTATLESGTVKALSQPVPPAPPATVAETGLHPDTLAQLMMKTLVAGEASGTQLSEAMRLPYSVLDAMVQHARVEKLVEVRGASGAGSAGYRYALTDLGRERAMQFMDINRYVGPAPVSADIFRFSLASQSMFRATTTGGTELLLRVDQIASQPSDGDKISEVVVPRLDYFILPAGNYSMSIHNRSTANATDNIPYTLGIQTVAAITGCPANLSQQTYIYPGIVYDGSVATDDCPTTVQGLFGDNYWITMVPTSTYQISASADIGLRIELVLCCTGNTVPVRFASSGPGTVSMTYQPPSAGLYVLNVIGNTLSAPVGPYTLRVTKQ